MKPVKNGSMTEFVFESEEEAEAWLAELDKRIAEHKRRVEEGLEEPCVWVPATYEEIMKDLEDDSPEDDSTL